MRIKSRGSHSTRYGHRGLLRLPTIGVQPATDFESVLRKSNVPQDVVETLRTNALKTPLFLRAKATILCVGPTGVGTNPSSELTNWLSTVVERIREFGERKQGNWVGLPSPSLLWFELLQIGRGLMGDVGERGWRGRRTGRSRGDSPLWGKRAARLFGGAHVKLTVPARCGILT